MLLIANRPAIAAFPGREEIRVSASANRPRLEAEHAPDPESATREVAVRHAHEPVDAAQLIVTTIAAVKQELRECIAVSHQLPRPGRAMNSVHRRRIREPGGARRLARGKQDHRPRFLLRVSGVWFLRRLLLLIVRFRCRGCFRLTLSGRSSSLCALRRGAHACDDEKYCCQTKENMIRVHRLSPPQTQNSDTVRYQRSFHA
jgi:hypothetical protein